MINRRSASTTARNVFAPLRFVASVSLGLSLAGCAAPLDPIGAPEGEGASEDDAADDPEPDFPPEVDCFDIHEAPEMSYEDADDPRLADPEYEWARELVRPTECAWCHVGEGSENQDAPPLWEFECRPAFTDSATDDTLRELSIAAGVNNLREAATAEEVARFQDLIAVELERRAERRGE